FNSEHHTAGRLRRQVLQSISSERNRLTGAFASPTAGSNSRQVHGSRANPDCCGTDMVESRQDDQSMFTRRVTVAAACVPLALPLFSLAQPNVRVRRIGLLSLTKSTSDVNETAKLLFLESLQRRGWEPGRTLVIEARFAEGDVTQLDALA